MTHPAHTAGQEFENRIRHSFKAIGLKDVDGGPSFRVGDHQIDACGGWDDILLVAECTQSINEQASIHNLISELRGKQLAIKQGFRRLDQYETYRRFQFAIVTKNIRYTDGDRTLALQRPVIHLLDWQTFEYYQKLASLIGPRGALFNFLGELHVEPRDFDLPRVPAFRIQLSRGLSGYLFWCEPQDLLKVAYVARRESGRQKYYQRMLAKNRLSKIRDFVQKGGIFPNNIIVAFDQRPNFRPKPAYDNAWPSWLEFGELIFPPSYRSCWIVDGQHRLYAFINPASNLRYQKLAVFAFDPISEHRQAKFFIVINKEQKPVSLDLIWDLEGEMSSDTPRGRIANCVKILNSMPSLRDKIFLPLSGERTKGQLKLSGICQDLEDIGLLKERTKFMTQTQKNPLILRLNYNQIPNRVASALSDFFDIVKSQMTDNTWTSLILRPGGITLALNVYEQILIRVGQIPSIQTLEGYVQHFVETLNEYAPNQTEMRRFVRTQLTSYAQRRQISVEVLAKMREKMQDPQFALVSAGAIESLSERLVRFERRLAEYVAQNLSILNISDLRQKSNEATSNRISTRLAQESRIRAEVAIHELLGLGETREIIERRENANILMPFFTDPVDGFGDEQAVFAALSCITKARNALHHGRRIGNRRLLLAYLETFEDIISS